MGVFVSLIARIAFGMLFVVADAALAGTGSLGQSDIPQPDVEASDAYAKAIRTTLQQAWEPASYSNTMEPGSTCAARISQTPGGYIQSVDFYPDCKFSTADKASINEVVRRSEPLPYKGFEGFFQREIRMVFQAASVADREILVAAQAEARVRQEKYAAEDRQWDATTGLKLKRDEYVGRCRFHLLWDSPRIQLKHRLRVTIAVDKAGKVVDIVDKYGKRAPEAVFEKFLATQPCDPPPVELLTRDGTFKLDPAFVGGN